MRLIDADALKEKFKERSYWTYTHEYGDAIPIGWIMSGIDNAPTVEPDMDFAKECYANGYEDGKNERPQGEWSNHTVACLLAELFGDMCACNFCGIDEWLPKKCDFANKECPDVVGVACWEQFLKHRKGGAEW